MNRIADQFASIGSVGGVNTGFAGYSVATQNREDGSNKTSFQDVLRQKQTDYGNAKGVVFSKHANQRLEHRNMNLSQEQLERLNSGVEQARAKNIKESLIMVDDMTFIVNVPNNTVVTALNVEDEQNVFTNIDGAVIS